MNTKDQPPGGNQQSDNSIERRRLDNFKKAKEALIAEYESSYRKSQGLRVAIIALAHASELILANKILDILIREALDICIAQSGIPEANGRIDDEAKKVAQNARFLMRQDEPARALIRFIADMDTIRGSYMEAYHSYLFLGDKEKITEMSELTKKYFLVDMEQMDSGVSSLPPSEEAKKKMRSEYIKYIESRQNEFPNFVKEKTQELQELVEDFQPDPRNLEVVVQNLDNLLGNPA